MSTVSRGIWIELLANGGRYLDDPLPESLWTYIQVTSRKTCFKICYNDAAEGSLLASEWIRSPRLAWSKAGGITDHGKTLLAE